MFIGSNAEKIVRNSDVPVLIIKKEENDFQVNDFVFASDFAEEIKKPFQKVVDFANKFDATLHLAMINTPNNFKSTSFAEEIMKKELDYMGNEKRWITYIPNLRRQSCKISQLC